MRDASGRLLTRSGDAPLPPFTAGDGFADLKLGTPAHAWRSFSQWDTARARQVMVLVKVEERAELAEDVAVQLAEPGLWLLPAEAQAAALQQIGADALRAGHVTSQLLALARTGAAGMLQAPVPLDLAELARSVVAGHAQAAWQSGHPLLLELALRNLIDNALQHSAQGAAVCVR